MNKKNKLPDILKKKFSIIFFNSIVYTYYNSQINRIMYHF